MPSPTDTYAAFMQNFPNFTPISVLSCVLLGLMRIAPIVSINPFFGSKLPGGVKIAFAFAITFILLPKILLTSSAPLTFGMPFIALAIKELFIGLLIGFLSSIPFYFADSAGVLIDFIRGSSSLQVSDPTFMQSQTSPIGQLYHYVVVVLFYDLNGPVLLYDGLLNSYSAIPADQWLSSSFFILQQPWWKLIMKLLTTFTAIAIQLGAPSIVAVLMAETFLGIANRLAQQVQIAFLGMAFKSLAGLALLWAGWFFILKQAGKQTLDWMMELDKIISYMRA